MLKCLTCWLTFGLAQANAQLADPAQALPFWRTKPKVYERIQNREVIVSVTTSDSDSKSRPHLLHVHGGGQTVATCEFTYAQSLQPQNLTLATSYVTASTYDEKTHHAQLTLAAFSHEAHLEVELEPLPEPEPRRLRFKILSGPLTGFSGEMIFTEIKAQHCEVGISGQYLYDRFPLPKFFIEFGLEVVLQRMASRLRAFVEDRYHEKGLHVD